MAIINLTTFIIMLTYYSNENRKEMISSNSMKWLKETKYLAMIDIEISEFVCETQEDQKIHSLN